MSFLAVRKSPILISHICWPNSPVRMCIAQQINSVYVTPKLPTLVVRMPVWYSIQLELHQATCAACITPSPYHKHEEDVVTLHPHGLARRQHKETHREGVAAVIEQLAQGRAALGAPGLLPVDGIQGLVDENARRREVEGLRRDDLREGVVVVQHYRIRQDHKHPPDERD